ncbi:tellurite resistance protein TehA-like permease [Branchiibius hedensis]|uniref:Tellurite resistance protein TehA n=1 Tax=Branchiibius hedensis TaxID=672460 RepID=A0A2Y8ZUX8_9MICO|nr:C4-dicarboxylate ABC transporter [Branchiibius hedensis]PWJ26934.1 tellurite resistance protein TehA-like permease [Branchiibius hedensis]SSA35745.1 Tellurite resistance protein TehA [Branchiibius hedensis]
MKAAAPTPTFEALLTRIHARQVSSATKATALPPVGPAWFPSVMGTAILALLVEQHLGRTPIGHLAAAAWLVAAWVALLWLCVAFARRCRRSPGALRESVSDPSTVALWGTVSMAVLATGSATLAVGQHAGWAVVIDLATWTVGTSLGLVTVVVFGLLVARGGSGRPTMVWGLAVVSPMVTATGGASLAAALPRPWGVLVRTSSELAFATALVLAVVVFASAYHHHLRIAPLPLELSATSWIPLGVVGQSMAAAQTLGAGTEFESVTHVYGFAMLIAAVPVIGYAVRRTASGFARGMPFATNWWSLTFPIGTLSLGTHLLGAQTGLAWVSALSWLTLLSLAGTWTFCAVSTARAVIGAWRGSSAPVTGSTGPAWPARPRHHRPRA